MNAFVRFASQQRIAIIGAGPMGTSLAAMLGCHMPVSLVVRNRLRAHEVLRDGVGVQGKNGAVARPHVVACITELEQPVDVIFVATKTHAIDIVAEELSPILSRLGGQSGPPFVISFQNGIESGRELMQRLGHSRVLRMVLNYGGRLREDGVCEIMHEHPPHAIGGPNAAHMTAAQSLAELLTASGLETIAVSNIEPIVWNKGVLNAAMSPVAALTNGSIGEVLDSPARSIVAELIDEGLAVARAESIELPTDIRTRLWQELHLARAHTPSMVEDIRAGRPSEVGQLNRQIIVHGQRLGVPVPGHALIASLIDAFDWRVFKQQQAIDAEGRAMASNGPRCWPPAGRAKRSMRSAAR